MSEKKEIKKLKIPKKAVIFITDQDIKPKYFVSIRNFYREIYEEFTTEGLDLELEFFDILKKIYNNEIEYISFDDTFFDFFENSNQYYLCEGFPCLRIRKDFNELKLYFQQSKIKKLQEKNAI